MVDRVAQILRTSGAMEVIQPIDQMRQNEDVARVVMRGGGIYPEAADPLRTPITYRWAPSDTGRQRAAQSGTVVLLAAYAATPPNTGNCIVTLTSVTAVEGIKTLGTCQITNGSSIGEAQLNEPIPVGAWLGATVTSANGASGVSISVTQKV